MLISFSLAWALSPVQTQPMMLSCLICPYARLRYSLCFSHVILPVMKETTIGCADQSTPLETAWKPFKDIHTSLISLPFQACPIKSRKILILQQGNRMHQSIISTQAFIATSRLKLWPLSKLTKSAPYFYLHCFYFGKNIKNKIDVKYVYPVNLFWFVRVIALLQKNQAKCSHCFVFARDLNFSFLLNKWKECLTSGPCQTLTHFLPDMLLVKVFCIIKVVVLLLHDKHPSNDFGCMSLNIGGQYVSVHFSCHSVATTA